MEFIDTDNIEGLRNFLKESSSPPRLLIHAIRQKKINAVKLLINSVFPLNIRDETGKNILMIACDNIDNYDEDAEKIVKIILSTTHLIDTILFDRDNFGDNIIHIAGKSQNTCIFEKVCMMFINQINYHDYGKIINEFFAVNYKGNTILHDISDYYSEDILNILNRYVSIRKLASIKNSYGQSALSFASIKNNIDLVIFYILKEVEITTVDLNNLIDMLDRVNMDVYDNDFENEIFYDSYRNLCVIIEDMKLNIWNSYYKGNLDFYPEEFLNYDISQINDYIIRLKIILKNTEPDTKGIKEEIKKIFYKTYNNGETILIKILRENIPQKFKKLILLLESGFDCNINHISDRGRTALYYACRTNNEELVKFLLKYDVEIPINIQGGIFLTLLKRYRIQRGNLSLDEIIKKQITKLKDPIDNINQNIFLENKKVLDFITLEEISIEDFLNISENIIFVYKSSVTGINKNRVIQNINSDLFLDCKRTADGKYDLHENETAKFPFYGKVPKKLEKVYLKISLINFQVYVLLNKFLEGIVYGAKIFYISDEPIEYLEFTTSYKMSIGVAIDYGQKNTNKSIYNISYK